MIHQTVAVQELQRYHTGSATCSFLSSLKVRVFRPSAIVSFSFSGQPCKGRKAVRCGGRFTCGPFPSLIHAQGRSSFFLSFFRGEKREMAGMQGVIRM